MDTSHKLIAEKGGVSREVIATIGSRYRVMPINPKKLKHRGRVCVIESFDDGFMPEKAIVRFDDNHRVGKVDLCDLVDAQ